MRVTLIIVVNAFFVFVVWALLSMGEAAQRTYNFSVLKELETKGILGTNNADQIISILPGRSLIEVEPTKEFHLAIILTCLLWATCSIAFCVKKINQKVHKDNWKGQS